MDTVQILLVANFIFLKPTCARTCACSRASLAAVAPEERPASHVVISRLPNAFTNARTTRGRIDLFQKSSGALASSAQQGVDDMEQEYQHAGARLFTLRLWQEVLGGGQVEWRGRAQDIGTGASAYFRDLPGLITVLSRLLEAPATPAEPQPADLDPYAGPLDTAGR
jgi:hypothetical protein